MSALTLSDAKEFLNVGNTTSDVELQEFIDAAEAALSARGIELATSAQKSRRVDAGTYALALPDAPIVGLVSVTPITGTSLDLSLFYVNQEAGLVTYEDGSLFTPGSYDVVYTAGRETVSDDLLMADKLLVKHMWETQRGSGTRRPGAGGGDIVAPVAGEWPPRVKELLVPYTGLGFA